jgi:hypothetical protein
VVHVTTEELKRLGAAMWKIVQPDDFESKEKMEMMLHKAAKKAKVI